MEKHTELTEAYRTIKGRTDSIQAENGEIIICDSCHFSFDVNETGCEICLACLKFLRCKKFVAEHSLCACGDSWCVHNDKERRAKAEKLHRLFNHQVP